MCDHGAARQTTLPELCRRGRWLNIRHIKATANAGPGTATLYLNCWQCTCGHRMVHKQTPSPAAGPWTRKHCRPARSNSRFHTSQRSRAARACRQLAPRSPGAPQTASGPSCRIAARSRSPRHPLRWRLQPWLAHAAAAGGLIHMWRDQNQAPAVAGGVKLCRSMEPVLCDR
jgi:hypothetical protein